MKTTLMMILTTLTVSAHAAEIKIEIPYPETQERFYGTIATVEKDLRAKIQAKAIEVCGGADKIGGIGEVEARFHFDMIVENEKQFKGSYPLASASATVGCRD